jgi:hypothetical protein
LVVSEVPNPPHDYKLRSDGLVFKNIDDFRPFIEHLCGLVSQIYHIGGFYLYEPLIVYSSRLICMDFEIFDVWENLPLLCVGSTKSPRFPTYLPLPILPVIHQTEIARLHALVLLIFPHVRHTAVERHARSRTP